MKIKKRVNGHDIILDYKPVKVYPNKYTIYDVYNGNKYLYRVCLNDLDIVKIKENGYMINDEEVFN